jgi:release factor glutamine methyltransferase
VNRQELVDELTALLGARHEARFIVEDVVDESQPALGTALTTSEIETSRAMAERRRSGEPLQYVLGHWSFRHLDLLVDSRVLIPRPETEQVVEVALKELDRLSCTAPVMVDAGTGSGAIALSLATELAGSHPEGQVWAVDASPDALALAAQNLERTEAAHSRLLPTALIEGSWLEALPDHLRGSISLVVSNPPYVAETDWDELPPEVRREPRQALIADTAPDGTAGLADVVTLLSQAANWLARPGAVVIELAPHQATAAIAIASSLGFTDVRVEPDLAQRPRALVGRLT